MPGIRQIPLALLFAAVGCSANPGPQAMPDGTLQVECASDVSYCVRRAESFCGDDPVEVIEAGSREGQHGDARYSDGARVSTVKFVCGKGPSVAIHLRKKREPDAPPTAPPVTPAPPATATVCQAGSTQACVGPGACSGGQVCLPDGSGWAACDCGDTTSPAGDAANSASGGSADSKSATD
jgi:hypothetical protein